MWIFVFFSLNAFTCILYSWFLNRRYTVQFKKKTQHFNHNNRNWRRQRWSHFVSFLSLPGFDLRRPLPMVRLLQRWRTRRKLLRWIRTRRWNNWWRIWQVEFRTWPILWRRTSRSWLWSTKQKRILLVYLLLVTLLHHHENSWNVTLKASYPLWHYCDNIDTL